MIKVIELRNFRGFVEASLNGLARINVITGLNGSGKTSILEAAFLVSGGANPSLVASLHGFRGETAWRVGFDRPFRSLFRNLDPSIHPKIVAASSVTMKTSKRYRRELTIKPSYVVTQGRTTTAPATILRGVMFEFDGPSGRKRAEWGWGKDIADLTPPKPENPRMLLGGDPVENPDLIPARFISPYVREVHPSSYELLTDLIKKRRLDEVVNALKMIHPSLRSLQPLTDKEDQVIYADVGEPNLLPISLLGSGLTNCLHIVLPSLLDEDGILVVDEFEDGIHHSLLTPILRVVIELAAQRRNQLFVTTHSQEFVRHLIALMKERNDSDIVFFRLGRLGLKGMIPRYGLSEAEELLDSNVDIR